MGLFGGGFSLPAVSLPDPSKVIGGGGSIDLGHTLKYPLGQGSNSLSQNMDKVAMIADPVLGSAFQLTDKLLNRKGPEDVNKATDASLAEQKKQFRSEQDIVKGKLKARMDDPGRMVQKEMADQENQMSKQLEAEQRAGGMSGGKAMEAKALLNRQYAAQAAKMADALERQTALDYGKQSTAGASAEAAFLAAEKSGQMPDRPKGLLGLDNTLGFL